jgi:hypothetical protein
MADSIKTLQQILSLEETDAETLLLLTHWVDQEMAIRAHGYPKDNLIPPPIEARLADRDYVALLIDAARDEEDVGEAVVSALVRHLETLDD